MTPTKQFWALFKFQSRINPFLWFMPLAFGFPMLFPWFGDTFTVSHPNLFSLIFNPSLFGFAIFGAMVLAPERLFFAANASPSIYSGSEFILTRAVDRPIFYRAKAAFFFLVVSVIPLIGLLHALPHPDVVVEEYSGPMQQATLAAVPGSTLLPPEKKNGKPSLIALPRGNIVAAEWQMLLLVMLVILTQVTVAILYPFKYGRWIFWITYVLLAFTPFLDITHKTAKGPTVNEAAFFAFAGHQLLFFCLTAVAFIVTQLWCERRFARTEF